MEPAESSLGAVSSYVAPLGELVATLTATGDPRQILAVVMAHLRPWRVDAAELVLVDPDADGRPHAAWVVGTWRDGHVLSDSHEPPAVDLTDPLWRVTPPAPVLDAAAGVALLPLFNAGHGGWQGVLRLAWTAARAFSADERAVYALLMAVLAAHLGGLRTQSDLRVTLAERESLQEISRQLNLALTLEDRLRALLLPAPAPEEAEVVLCTIDSDERGAPTWLNLISALSGGGGPPNSETGVRYHLPSIPFAKFYLSSPDAPLLIADVMTDPRVDDYARSLYATTGVRSTIVLALTLHGRWVGLLNITWPRPVTLGDREQRQYQALAKQAALLLDNSLMVERLRATLQESQQQGELLRTVLDHVPVGMVLLAAPTSRAVLANPAATRLFGLKAAEGVEEGAQPYRVVFPGTDRPIPPEEYAAARAMRTGATESAEMDVIVESGDRRHLEVTGVPMLAQGAVKSVLAVITDVTARKRAESERIALQDEVIRVQAVALAERSSPVIPITDEILVLPIIGSIDAERGRQLLATILEGTARMHARVVIIDITGVGAVDTQAATTLTSAARALRLLGVEPILSGIRPDVAQILVGLDIPLTDIVTCGTLQSSIQHALRRLGRPGFHRG